MRYGHGVRATRGQIMVARTTGRSGHGDEQQDGDHERSQHNRFSSA
jgi:hypothetical protein